MELETELGENEKSSGEIAVVEVDVVGIAASCETHTGQTSKLETELGEDEVSSERTAVVRLDVTDGNETLSGSHVGQTFELGTELVGSVDDEVALLELDVVVGDVLLLCEFGQTSESGMELVENGDSSDRAAVVEPDVVVGRVTLRTLELVTELLEEDGVSFEVGTAVGRTMAVLRTAPPVSLTPTTGTKPPVILSVGVSLGVRVVVAADSSSPVAVRVATSSPASPSALSPLPGARSGAETSGSATSTTR